MKKLKAGSLQLVTFIVVVIALLLSAFIILIHVHKQFRTKTDHVIETVGLVDKGVNYVLHNESLVNDTISVPLYDEDYKSVKAYKSFWGMYEKVYSVASIKGNTLKKTALIGSQLDDSKGALYLKDNNKPVVLVGHTKIRGKAYLPKRGVKSGNISGVSYYGDTYIYGQTALSKSFPKINNELLKHIKTLDKSTLNPKTAEYINLEKSKTHINSFENPLQFIYSHSEITLSDVSLTGHIKIQSQTKIVVDASAHLTDVVLMAPIIEIKSNVKGAFQAFATKYINVAKYVTLNYPSTLVLNKDYVKEASDMHNMIFVDDHSVVKGSIVALGLSSSNNYDSQIKINPNATIKGAVYCEQNLELRGTVYGTVYANNFIIKEAGSIYQNHLYNALINSDELESEYMGLLFTNSKKGIAKWLY
ncbi:hypothetical protein FBALC1_12422 [Flavobacteriales bacterium ALC-1]|nr:hypothetical protein FBALC1_12422 [Flavobacteriales bacterium ALC-1]